MTPSIVADNTILAPVKAEATGSGVLGRPRQYSKFEANLSYVKPTKQNRHPLVWHDGTVGRTRAAKSGDLRLLSRTHMLEEEKDHHVSSVLPQIKKNMERAMLRERLGAERKGKNRTSKEAPRDTPLSHTLLLLLRTPSTERECCFPVTRNPQQS